MKPHPPYDPELEAALDEVDAVLTAEIIGEILRDLREPDEEDADRSELLPPADRPSRPAKRKQ